jgi:hypothetical protein
MQLVAVGAQNLFLTNNPSVTFWKVKYNRHTNFAMESMRQVLNGNGNFGNKVSCKVSRNGDLMGACYVQATLPDPSGVDSYCNAVGFRLLKECQLRVGGQLIDKQSSTWMHCWNELTAPVEKQANASTNLTSTLSRLVGLKTADGAAAPAYAEGNTWRVNVPLQFAFCRHPGLALPLIALQYHEVELTVELATKNEVLQAGTGGSSLGNLTDLSLYVDYIFLDVEERKQFAQGQHEYVIETVQEQTQSVTAGSTNNVRLNFNHPVKELVWVIRNGTNRDVFTDFLDSAQAHPVTEATLKLNGTERFAKRPGLYFSGVQPYQHHSGNPDNGICAYSFALRPEEHQPSGTCNFSRIDNAELSVTTTANGSGTITVMAHGYNVFRVASGMGGLAYSN